MMSIKNLLAEKLLNSGSTVKSNVIDTLYQNELTTRTNACISLLKKIEAKENELKKSSVADNVIYDKDGVPLTEGYSKNRVEELKKLRKEITALETALSDALEKNDFTKALELGK